MHRYLKINPKKIIFKGSDTSSTSWTCTTKHLRPWPADIDLQRSEPSHAEYRLQKLRFKIHTKDRQQFQSPHTPTTNPWTHNPGSPATPDQNLATQFIKMLQNLQPRTHSPIEHNQTFAPTSLQHGVTSHSDHRPQDTSDQTLEHRQLISSDTSYVLITDSQSPWFKPWHRPSKTSESLSHECRPPSTSDLNLWT